MDAKRFSELQEKVAKLTKEVTMAEGANAELMKRLKEEHNINSVEELEKEISKFQKDIEDKKETMEALSEKLENMVDWDKV